MTHNGISNVRNASKPDAVTGVDVGSKGNTIRPSDGILSYSSSDLVHSALRLSRAFCNSTFQANASDSSSHSLGTRKSVFSTWMVNTSQHEVLPCNRLHTWKVTGGAKKKSALLFMPGFSAVEDSGGGDDFIGRICMRGRTAKDER